MGQSVTASNADDDSVDLKGGELKVGDRVLVSGAKNGVLRFIGTTEFAQGVWGGVELDQPIGKNDGSVQGKRLVIFLNFFRIFLILLLYNFFCAATIDFLQVFRLQAQIRFIRAYGQNRTSCFA